MSLRTWVVIGACVALVGWWWTRAPDAPAAAVGANVQCPPPPRVATGGEPLQSPVPGDFREIRLAPATLQPLAGFSLDARVLSREDYSLAQFLEFECADIFYCEFSVCGTKKGHLWDSLGTRMFIRLSRYDGL